MSFVVHADCHDFIKTFEPQSIDLLLFDPPYFGIVKDSWDNQWKSTVHYVDWIYTLLELAKPKMKPHGSVVFFGGIGKHGHRPFFEIIRRIEDANLYTYRNLITWKKRRAYGTETDYLFCREEIVWYSNSSLKKCITFNKPYLDVKRGYDGFNKKYPAKSEYKRVSNVWDDAPELMRPKRNTQKPLALMKRLVTTHSNLGDLVVDPMAGWGTTGEAAIELGRNFRGCEAIEADAIAANERCNKLAYER